MTQNDGLWVFCAVTACNVIGLFGDLLLMVGGYPMVTDIARRNVPVGMAILGVNFLGLCGLAYHFFAPNGKP